MFALNTLTDDNAVCEFEEMNSFPRDSDMETINQVERIMPGSPAKNEPLNTDDAILWLQTLPDDWDPVKDFSVEEDVCLVNDFRVEEDVCLSSPKLNSFESPHAILDDLNTDLPIALPDVFLDQILCDIRMTAPVPSPIEMAPFGMNDSTSTGAYNLIDS